MFHYATIRNTNHTIIVPEKEFQYVSKDLTLVPLRGYGHMLAVFQDSEICLGWIATSALGFNNVTEYLKENAT